MCCISTELKSLYSALLFQKTFGINISEKIENSAIHTGTAYLYVPKYSASKCTVTVIIIQDNEILNKYSQEFRRGL